MNPPPPNIKYTMKKYECAASLIISISSSFPLFISPVIPVDSGVPCTQANS